MPRAWYFYYEKKQYQTWGIGFKKPTPSEGAGGCSWIWELGQGTYVLKEDRSIYKMCYFSSIMLYLLYSSLYKKLGSYNSKFYKKALIEA